MLVSFYILAYNHEQYIAQAISNALQQTYSPLEIIISDDCSTDRTWEIIQSSIAGYKGPHRVIARRNMHNLGISAHINALWQVCDGEWIVASAGDDVSVAERVERIMAYVKARPDIKLYQSWLTETDSDLNVQRTTENNYQFGRPDAGLYLFDMASRIQDKSFWPHGAAMAYSRDIIDVYGPMDSRIIFEDNVVNVRAELLGLTAVLPIPLVLHRNHAGQITHSSTKLDFALLEARRMRRLESDINSTLQNIKDVGLAEAAGLITLSTSINDYFRRRLDYFILKNQALTASWPERLRYAHSLIKQTGTMAPLSRDDLIRCFLPDFLYKSLKI
jgi:GT2 family glycosyltransferase